MQHRKPPAAKRMKKRWLVLPALFILALGGALNWWFWSRDADLDRLITSFMAKEGLPGAVVAGRDARGRTLLRAYGLADAATGRAMKTDTPLRLASLSKPITAAAVMTLVERGVLHLDDRLVDLLPLPPARDARVGRITVRHLLQHAAGWDRTRDFEPLVDDISRQRELGLGVPPDCGPIAFAMLGRSMQFDPGTAYAYSNLGYCFLELLIARHTGVPYAEFVTRDVLAPRGGAGLRLGEAGFAPETLARPAAPDRIPSPAEIVLFGAAGGWVGTASDILAFVAGPVPVEAAVPPPFFTGGPNYYGLGWRVWPGTDGPTLSHFGAVQGTFTVAIRLPDGLSLVVLFNARPGDDEAAFARLYKTLPAAVRRALDRPDG